MEIQSTFHEFMADLLQEFRVPDILLPTSMCIFILESPHVQELKFGAPVSGSSGATMTKHLFGEEYAKFPLGLLVKKNAVEQKHRPRLDRIGLMNVCNVPMQASAYGQSPLVKKHGQWLTALEQIRSNNQRDDYRDPVLNLVQSELVASLRSKLLELSNQPCTVVPCGRFAQKFVRLAQVQSSRWQVIDGVPHPSYNSWDRTQYADVVAQVKQALNGEAL